MKNSTTRILTITVVILLLANLGLVYLILTGKGRSSRMDGRREPFDMMVKELKMTDQQQKDFKAMKEEHFKNVRPLFDSVRAAKIALYGLMREKEVPDSTIDQYEQRYLQQQAKLDRMTIEHFRQVRGLFTAEQLPKYDSFINRMMERRRGGDRSGDKDRK